MCLDDELLAVDILLEDRDATYQDDLTPVTVVTDAAGTILETLPGVPNVSTLRRLLAQTKAADTH
jgi:hypothetical protein